MARDQTPWPEDDVHTDLELGGTQVVSAWDIRSAQEGSGEVFGRSALPKVAHLAPTKVTGHSIV